MPSRSSVSKGNKKAEAKKSLPEDKVRQLGSDVLQVSGGAYIDLKKLHAAFCAVEISRIGSRLE